MYRILQHDGASTLEQPALAVNKGLEQMLAELESHRLEVVLVPLNPKLRGYNEGGCKRVCADKSPLW